ncbi:MAG TPA: hypothetical protein VJZ26_14555 [Blastocatellia bacterium]|nr:hypothetical protein [Blastocatellia bacterium]
MAVQLGSINLANLTQVAVRERARLVHHTVPGLNGDLAQVLGRPSVEVAFRGVFIGPDAADRLGELRALHLEHKPVDFFADAVGEGYFAQVLVSRFEIEQRAGELDQYNFYCEVIEYVEPPEPAASDSMLGLDTGLLDEAAGFMDDVQNALEQVSQLADLIGNAPSFGDPTKRLVEMPGSFTELAGDNTLQTLISLRDLF